SWAVECAPRTGCMQRTSESAAARVDEPGAAQEEARRLKVGIPREIEPGERRVAATPATVARLRKQGLEVLVQAGAGEGASLLDAAYQEAGARIVAEAEELYGEADLVIKVRAPGVLPGDGHEI